MQAREQVELAAKRLETLRQSKADRREVRTAECDWFGAEETLALANAAAAGRLNAAIASVMPAEIQLMRIGPWFFVGWPGEVFVEFALMVKASSPELPRHQHGQRRVAGIPCHRRGDAAALVRGDEFPVLQSRGGNGAGESDAGVAASRRSLAAELSDIVGATRGKDSGDRPGNDATSSSRCSIAAAACANVCRIPSPVAAAEAGRMELPADAFTDAIARGNRRTAGTRRRWSDRRRGGHVRHADQQLSCCWTPPVVRLRRSFSGPIAARRTSKRKSAGDATFRDSRPRPAFRRLSFQFMAAKLLWLQRQSPTTWDQTNKLCLISDYFTLLLTGKHVTEAGAAGLTGLIDIHRCRWWPEMLARFSIDRRLAPLDRSSGNRLGADRSGGRQTLRPAGVVPFRRRLSRSIRRGNRGGQHRAGNALGNDRHGAGDGSLCRSIHRSAWSRRSSRGRRSAKELYWQMVFGDVSANYLQWYRDQLPDRPDFEQLTALAESIAPGAEGLRLKTAVGLTDPQEVFEGMTPQHTRGHAVRCILEAVAVALREQIATLSDGAMPQEIRCAGGAARSALWLQIKADVLGRADGRHDLPRADESGRGHVGRGSAARGRPAGKSLRNGFAWNRRIAPIRSVIVQYQAIYSRMSA